MIPAKSKTEVLTNAVKSFRDSEQSSEDYMNFIVATVGCFRQGTGLLWSDAREILEEIIK